MVRHTGGFLVRVPHVPSLAVVGLVFGIAVPLLKGLLNRETGDPLGSREGTCTGPYEEDLGCDRMTFFDRFLNTKNLSPKAGLSLVTGPSTEPDLPPNTATTAHRSQETVWGGAPEGFLWISPKECHRAMVCKTLRAFRVLRTYSEFHASRSSLTHLKQLRLGQRCFGRFS